MGIIPDDEFLVQPNKAQEAPQAAKPVGPINKTTIADDDFLAIPKDAMPSTGTATLYGAGRNIIPSIAGLISGTFGGMGGAVASGGSPAAAYTVPAAAFAASAAGAAGTAKVQEMFWKPGLREQIAASDSPNAYSWGGMIPGFATGRPVSLKDFATKAGRTQMAIEAGSEFGGDVIVNGILGEQQSYGQSAGQAAFEALLQGHQTRVGSAISNAPINLANYLVNRPAGPAAPITPGTQQQIVAEARSAQDIVPPTGPLTPAVPTVSQPQVVPTVTQGQAAAPVVATPTAAATPAVATPAAPASPAATAATAAAPAATATPAAPVVKPSVQPGTAAAVTAGQDGRGQVTHIPDHIPAHETLAPEQLRAAHAAMEPAQAANSIIGLNAEAHRRNGINKPADPAFVERILTHTGTALRDLSTRDQGLAISTGEGISRLLERHIATAKSNPDATPYKQEQIFEMEYRKARIDDIVNHIRKGGREPLPYSMAGAAEYVKNMKYYAGKDAEVEASRNTPPTPEQAQAESELDIQEVPVKFSTRKFVPNPDKTRTDGTSVYEDGEAPIVEYTAPGNPGRLMVIRNINGVQVPFYLSTGSAGKKDVPAGKWYPFFGVKDAWINKTGGKDMANYQNRKELAAVARQLDRTIGDIRHKADRDLFPKVGNREALVHINQGFDPAGSGDADARAKVDANIKNLFDRLDAAAAQRKPKPVQPAQTQEAQSGATNDEFPDPVGAGAQKVFKDALSTDTIDGALIKNEVPIVSKLDKRTAEHLLQLFKKMAKANIQDGPLTQLGYATNLANIRKLEAHLAKLAAPAAKPTPKPAEPVSTELTPEAAKPTSLKELKADAEKKKADFNEAREKLKKMIPGIIVFKDGWERQAKKHSKEAAALVDEIKAKSKLMYAADWAVSDHPEEKAESRRRGQEILRQLKEKQDAAKKKPLTKKEQRAADAKEKAAQRRKKLVDDRVKEFEEENPDAPKDVKEAFRIITEHDGDKPATPEVKAAWERYDAYTLLSNEKAQDVVAHPGVEKYERTFYNEDGTVASGTRIKIKDGYTIFHGPGSGLQYTGVEQKLDGQYLRANNDSDAFRYLDNIVKESDLPQIEAHAKLEQAMEDANDLKNTISKYEDALKKALEVQGKKRKSEEELNKAFEYVAGKKLELQEAEAEIKKLTKAYEDKFGKFERTPAGEPDFSEWTDETGDTEDDADYSEWEDETPEDEDVEEEEGFNEDEPDEDEAPEVKPAKKPKKPKKDVNRQSSENPALDALYERQREETQKFEDDNEDRVQEIETIRNKSMEAYANADRKEGDRLDDLADEKEAELDKQRRDNHQRHMDERDQLEGEKKEPFTPEYDKHGSIINMPKDSKGSLPREVHDDEVGYEKLQKIHDYLIRLSVKHDKRAGRHNRGQTFREAVDEAVNHHYPINGVTNEGHRVGDIVIHEGYLQIISHASDNELQLEAIWPFDSIGAGGWGTDSSEIKATGKNILDNPDIDPAKMAKEAKLDAEMPFHEKNLIESKERQLSKIDDALKKAKGDYKEMLEQHKEMLLESIAEIKKAGKEKTSREHIGLGTDEEIAVLDTKSLNRRRNDLLNQINETNKDIEDGHASGEFKQEDNSQAAYDLYTSLRRKEIELSETEDQIKAMQDDGSWSGGELVSHEAFKKAWTEEVVPEGVAKQVSQLAEAKQKLNDSLEKLKYKGMGPKKIVEKIKEIDSQIEKLRTNPKTGRKYRNSAMSGSYYDYYEPSWAEGLSRSKDTSVASKDVKPQQLGGGVPRGELFDPSDDFNLSQETAAPPPVDRTEDTTGDFSTGAEPANIVAARQQLSKLEKSGKNPEQQAALRRTIAEYDAKMAKPDLSKMDGEQIFAELDRMAEDKFAGGMDEMNRVIDRIEQIYPGSKERIMSRAKEQQNDDVARAIDMYVRSELNSRMRRDSQAGQSEPKPSFDPDGFREVVNNDEVAMGILDHDSVVRGGKDGMLRPTAEIAEEMNVGIQNVSRLYKQLVKEKLVEAFKGSKVKTANGSYTTTYKLAKGVDYKTLQARLKKLANGLDAPLKDLMAALKKDVDDTTSKIHPSHGPLYALTEMGHTPSILKRIIKLGGTFDDIVKLFNIDVSKEMAADSRWGDHRIYNLRRMFAGKEPVNRVRRESIEREEAAAAAAAAPVQAKRTELKGVKGFQRGIQDMRDLLADSQDDKVRALRQSNVDKMEALLAATKSKPNESARLQTQRRKLKELLDGNNFRPGRSSGLDFAEMPKVRDIMDRIASYERLAKTSGATAESVLKPVSDNEPASITEARQQLSRIISNMSRGEGWDAKRRDAEAKIEQFELENKLLSGNYEPTAQDLEIISNAALEEFVAKFGSGDVDPAITSIVEAELSSRFEAQERAGLDDSAAGDTPSQKGDLLADIKNLIAEHGAKYGIPTLPKEFGAESLSVLREQLSKGQVMALMRNPVGMGKIDVERAKTDATYRKEMKDRAEGQLSDLAMALSELGWTQFDPANFNSDDLVQAIVAAGKGEMLTPKGGVLGVAAPVDMQAAGIIKRLYEPDAASPDDPFSRRDLSPEAAKRELERRQAQNAKNRAGDPEARKGYAGIVSRVTDEMRLRGDLTPKEIEGVTRIMNKIGAQFFEGVKMKVGAGSRPGEYGQYQTVERIITIFKDAIRNGKFEETAAHEIAHHIARFLPEADRQAVISELHAKRGEFLKRNKGLEALFSATDRRDWAKKRFTAQQIANANLQDPTAQIVKLDAEELKKEGYKPNEYVYRLKLTDETYRLTNPNEYFAEEFKDNVMRELNSDPVYLGRSRNWKEKLASLWQDIKINFRRMFGKEIANKILSNFAKGRYNPDEEGSADITGIGSDRQWDGGTTFSKKDRKLKADPVVDTESYDEGIYPIGEALARSEDGSTNVVNILGRNKMSPERKAQIDEFVKDSSVKHALYRGQKGGYETLDANMSEDGMFHIASDPDYAAQYAEDHNKKLPDDGTESAVIQVYINAKNIVDISKIGHSIDSRANIEKMRKLDNDGLSANEHIAAREDEFINKIISEVRRINEGKDLDLTELKEGLYEAFDEARDDHLNRLQTSVWQVFSHHSIHSLFRKYGVDAIKYSDSDLRTAQGGKRGGKDSYVLADPRRIKAAFGGNDVNTSSSNIFQAKREPKQSELDMRVSGEVRLQDAMGVASKNKLTEAEFERLVSQDPSFNQREWQSVMEEGHFTDGGPDARLKGARVYKRIALPSMADPSAEVSAQDSLPKNDVSNSGNGQVFKSVRDASTDQSEDPEVFKNPRSGESVTRSAWDIVSGRFFSGMSGKAHQNAKRHPYSKAVKAIANIIHSRPGTQSDAYGRDLPTAISTARSKYHTRLNKIMEPLRGMLGGFKDTDQGTAKQQREEVYQALNDMITGRKNITSGPIGEAAAGLKSLLSEIHDYRTAAGEAIGTVADYYPAVYDSPRIGDNRKDFIKDAKRAYEIQLGEMDPDTLRRELGLTKKEYEEMADNDPEKLEEIMDELTEQKALGLYNSHVRGAGAEEFDSIFGMANKSGAENPSMKRKFSRASQDIMRKWQVNDPFRVVGRYITSGVKRAEIVRRFGNEGERWRKLSTQMEKDGVPYEVISEMRELTRGAAGIGIPPRGKAGQTFVDTVTLMTASSAMGRGFLNNLVEPVTIGMRTGNPLDILRAYAETWTRFLRELPGLSPTLRAKMGETFWTQYGHEIGTIHNSIEDAWMTTHSMELDAEYADPRFRWLTNRVYKANLMDATETAKQQASHAIGFSFINRLASMARGDHWTAKLGMDAKQSVADQLSELGIAPEKQADFVEWAKKLQDANDADAMALMLGQDEMAKLHQEAMVRFSMQSSVRSNRAHKPAFQDNPLGKAFLQLMNFSYSYAAEVNSRMYDMAKQSLSFSPEGKNYTAYDRIRMMGPVAGGLLSILAYRGLLELKDLLYPSESSAKRAKDPEVVKWVNATSYAGLLGPKFEQMVKSIKRDQAVGGPVGQMAVNVGRAGKSVLEAAAEGKDMSGAKKSIAKASVPLIKGGIVMGTSAINPALGTVATQATNAPSFTNAIVPQDGKKSGGLTPDVFRLK